MSLHGKPDADQLLAAAVEFLRDELAPDVPERHRYHLRVAVNVLEIVRRELTLGPAQEHVHRARLAGLRVASDEELARRLRSGETDPAAVRDAVLRSVVDKLRVANPRYLEES